MPNSLRRFVAGFLTAFFILQPLGVVLAEEQGLSPVDEVGTPQSTTAAGDSLNDSTPVPVVQSESSDAPADANASGEEAISTESGEAQSMLLEEEGEATTNFAGPKNETRLSADETTGTLRFTYPISIPPGRNGMQPDIALSYSSNAASGDAGIIGHGWSLDLPSITRINRNGIEDLYSEEIFESTVDGELVKLSTGVFAPKVEQGNFNSYSFSANTWVVKDKSGTTFTFGATAASRMDNPADASKVYQWLLSEIRDTNDNFVSFAYFKDAGQVYPATVTYTGSGSTAGVFEVSFLRQSRPDVSTTYGRGFEVKTNHRIYEVDVRISGTLVRKYALSFVAGANGARSLLSSIVETGYDASQNATVLPPVSFAYQENTLADPFTRYTWDTEAGLRGSSGSFIANLNKDALADVLYGDENESAGYLNTGLGTFSESVGHASPIRLSQNGSSAYSIGLLDVNADGLLDETTVGGSYLGTGTGWTTANQWNLPYSPSNGSYPDNNDAHFADVNGDGLVDYFRVKDESDPTQIQVELNSGNGWISDSNEDDWVFPFTLDNDGLVITDINGDGLADILKAFEMDTAGVVTTTNVVYLNTGNRSFVQSSTFGPLPVIFQREHIESGVHSFTDFNIRVVDVNGDGLADLWDADYPNETYLNTGSGWEAAPGWRAPCYFNDQCHIADLNGDGMLDMIEPTTTYNRYYAYINESPQEDLLYKITTASGGAHEVTYKGAAEYMSAGVLLNPEDPFAKQVVSKIEKKDGSTITAATSYVYEGGKFYYASAKDRRFSGFARVTATDLSGARTATFFHQGDSSDAAHGEYADVIAKVGKVYRVERADGSGNLFEKSISKWDVFDLGSGRSFVKLAQTVNSVYDGDTSHKDTAESYTYSNTNGNLTQKVEYGDVTGADDGTFTDTGSDKFTTDYTYASNTTANILGLPSQSTTVNQSSAKVKESKYYYDAQSLGSVLKGNLTKQEDWKSSSTYVNSQRTYNSYGLVATSTDPRGKVTTYSYDSLNLYPATVTNPLSQVTSYTYDYSLGKPKQVTDANSRVFQTVYDGLDRVVEEKQPDLTTPTTLVTKAAYVYTDTSGAVSVKKSLHLDGSTVADSYTYFDGFGRPMQERTEAEGSNFAVKDFAYSNRELLLKESLPYFSTGTARTTATTTTALYTTYAYDAMRRVTTATDALGTTTNAYSDRKLTVTDANGKVKDLTKDAYGNLAQVDEHNGSSTYTTTYLYDYLGDLTKITDALGNVRNFTYDGLGRRLTAEDLHASADTTFGTWSYGFDEAGNLTSRTDAKGQVVNWTYDDVGRVLTENYTGATGTEVTYGYDAGAEGIGRMTSVANGAVSKTLTYNALGLLASETSTIDSINFGTTYSYDRQGNQVLLVNPDSSQVKSIFNSAGLLEKTQRKETTDGSFIDVVSNFDYAPTGQPTVTAYNNGVTTTNTYDAAKRYRLTNKLSQTSASAPTTTSFYAGAGDGYSTYTGSDLTWATAHDATAGNGLSTTDTWINVIAGKTSTPGYQITRGFLPFDTSSIPDGATVTAAKLKAYSLVVSNGSNNGNDFVTVVQSAQASTSAVANEDFDQAGAVSNPTEGVDSSQRKDLTGLGTSQYVTFDLNATGMGWVSKTGYTKLALRIGDDALNVAYNGATNSSNKFAIGASEASGTSTDPVLEVTYTTSSAQTLQDITYTYDNVGNVTRIVDSSPTSAAKTVDYTYDDLYRLTAAAATGVASGQSTYSQTFAYDAIGNMTSGPAGSYSYSGHTGSSYANPHAATSVGGVALAYDNNGNLLTKGSAMTNTWDYNNRMATSVAGTSGTQTPVYDDGALSSGWSSWSWGTTITWNSTEQVYSGTSAIKAVYTGSWGGVYAHKSSPLSVSSTDTLHLAIRATAASQNPYITLYNQSDAAIGTVSALSYISGGSMAANTWYVLNIPLSAFGVTGTAQVGDVDVEMPSATTMYFDEVRFETAGTGTTQTYGYDSTGQRVRVAAGASVTRYPTAEYNTDGTTAVKHVSGGATVTGTGSAAVARFVHADHLTGANVVTSAAGVQEELVDYFPYGGIRVDQKAGSFSEQRKYAGHEYDSATGLSYMKARYYDSSIGQFVSQDAAYLAVGDKNAVKNKTKIEQYVLLSDPQMLNSYSYARNNPIGNRDADGNFTVRGAVAALFAATGLYMTAEASELKAAGNTAAAANVDVAAGVAYGAAVATIAGPAAISAVGAKLASNPVVREKAVQLGSTAAARAAGVAGEAASKLTKNTVRIPSASNTASFRIPDGLNTVTKVISEVKNVAYQSLTNQISDFVSFAQTNGYKFELYVRSTTQLSAPLQTLVDAGKVVLKTLD